MKDTKPKPKETPKGKPGKPMMPMDKPKAKKK